MHSAESLNPASLQVQRVAFEEISTASYEVVKGVTKDKLEDQLWGIKKMQRVAFRSGRIRHSGHQLGALQLPDSTK